MVDEYDDRLRSMMEATSVMMAHVGRNHRYRSANHRYAAWFAREAADLVGERMVDVVGEAVYGTLEPHLVEVLAGREARVESEHPRLGPGRHLASTFAPDRTSEGEVRGYWVTAFDISDLKQAEYALAEERRSLEQLNETLATIAGNLDLDTVAQTVTDCATRLCGAGFGAYFWNVEDGFRIHAVSGAPLEAFEGSTLPRSTPLFEGVVRCDDLVHDARCRAMVPPFGAPHGTLPVRSYLAVPVVSRNGTVLGGLFFGHAEPRGFTGQCERLVRAVAVQAAAALENARTHEAVRRASEERDALLQRERSARAEAMRMSSLKDSFLATLSHELRTPLSAILGWAQVLRHGIRSDEDLQNGLETIERNARIQARLIEDLLDMSRIVSGKVRLDVHPIDPVVAVEAALYTVTPAADARSIRLERSLDPEIGLIDADTHRLQQIVWNLLSNAVKFTAPGGTVRVEARRVAGAVEIAVEDTGVGIREEFLPHVFERFRQADGTATRRHGGLGLGLSIVKHLVELHGGTVRATSAGEGQGSRFVVDLPLAPSSAAEPTPDPISGSTELTGWNLSGITVLVVDDEADARAFVARVLTDCDADVVQAASATEALRLVRERRPDVLVSDIGMPDVDGLELVRTLRSRGDQLPAIALTAFARSIDRVRALRAGYQVHIAKPVEPSELVATVASASGRTGRAN